ncbi:MAG: hypothetical protein R3D97_12455 [Paracoccaceae bacterium]
MHSSSLMVSFLALLALGGCVPADGQAVQDRSVVATLKVNEVDPTHVTLTAAIKSNELFDVCVWPGSPGRRVAIFADTEKAWLGSPVLRNDESATFEVLPPARYVWPGGWSFIKLVPGQIVSFWESLRFADFSTDIASRSAIREETLLRGRTKVPADQYVAQLRIRVYDCKDIPANLKVGADALDSFDAPYVVVVSNKTTPFLIANATPVGK